MPARQEAWPAGPLQAVLRRRGNEPGRWTDRPGRSPRRPTGCSCQRGGHPCPADFGPAEAHNRKNAVTHAPRRSGEEILNSESGIVESGWVSPRRTPLDSARGGPAARAAPRHFGVDFFSSAFAAGPGSVAALVAAAGLAGSAAAVLGFASGELAGWPGVGGAGGVGAPGLPVGTARGGLASRLGGLGRAGARVAAAPACPSAPGSTPRSAARPGRARASAPG